MAKEKPATKTCKHCKTEIPYDAKVCPQCRKKQGGGCLKFLLIAVIAVIVIFIAMIALSESPGDMDEIETFKEMSEEDFKKQCEEISYEDLARNPDSYKGKAIKAKLRIEQVVDDTYLRAYSNDDTDSWYGDEYVLYDSRDNGENLIEEDIVTVYGVYYGTETMERAIGGSDDIPCICLIYTELESK